MSYVRDFRRIEIAQAVARELRRAGYGCSDESVMIIPYATRPAVDFDMEGDGTIHCFIVCGIPLDAPTLYFVEVVQHWVEHMAGTDGTNSDMYDWITTELKASLGARA